MTIDQLLAIPPAELALLTDTQLADRLAPIIPIVRSAYVGQREPKIKLGDGAVISKRVLDRKADMVARLLKANGQSLE